MASFLGTLFGGASEKEAASKNLAALGKYTDTSYGFLDKGLASSTGALNTANQSANKYLGQNYDLYGNLKTAGTGILDAGKASSLAALNGVQGIYDPLQAKYGAGTSLYLDSLGVNGAGGNTRAVDSFQAGPAYEFTRDQGIEALNRRRAAAGMLDSGNADVDALKFGTGLANQTYGGWQDRLAGLINPEMTAASGAAGARGAISNLHQQDALARLGLEQGVTQGQAGANAGRGANDLALGNSLAGLYTGDASNRVGVAGNQLSGTTAANNMVAAGEIGGAKNILNAGMAGLQLAMGMPPTSLAGIGGGGGGGGGSFASLFGGGGGAASVGSLPGVAGGLPYVSYGK